jgi:hypothetical protein
VASPADIPFENNTKSDELDQAEKGVSPLSARHLSQHNNEKKTSDWIVVRIEVTIFCILSEQAG